MDRPKRHRPNTVTIDEEEGGNEYQFLSKGRLLRVEKEKAMATDIY